MATPAEIANDMAAQAAFWEKRNKAIARACEDSAVVIRRFLVGERVDGRTWNGLHRRLLDMSYRTRQTPISDNLDRALQILYVLKAEAGRT